MSGCTAHPTPHRSGRIGGDLTPFNDTSLLTGLRELSLKYTNITDAGLVHLRDLTKLYLLDLSHTDVADAGLVHLKELTNLYRLELYSTKVTDEGVSEFKQALPKCNVRR